MIITVVVYSYLHTYVRMYILLVYKYNVMSLTNTVAFTQNATGPSSVCEGSDVTLHCVIILTNSDNTTTVRDNLWSRNISGMVTAIRTLTPTPNHRQVFNATTGVFSDLMITNVTLEDNNAEYICTATGATITSSVVLNVTGKF